MAQRTTIENIVWSCTPIKEVRPISLNLMGINFAMPPTVPRNLYIKQAMAQIAMALAPLISIMKLAGVVKVIIDMLEATLTLNVAKMSEAFQKIIDIIGDVLAMIPQTSVPKFIFDLLSLFVMLLDVLIEEIEAIIAIEVAIDNAGNAYNAAQIQCARDNLVIIKAQKMQEVGNFLLILEPINVLLGLIGMDEIGASCGDSFDGLLAVLTTLRTTIATIVGEI